MKTNLNIWMRLATSFMPDTRQDWLNAMQTEFAQISDPAARRAFAFGCFKAALSEWTHSRKGLSLMARAAGAIALILFSGMGILFVLRLDASPDAAPAAQLILGLCLSYVFAAVLLLWSPKVLRIYAGIGCAILAAAWAKAKLTPIQSDALTTEFVSALHLEAAVLMGALFFASLYLNWLYAPRLTD